MEGEGKSTVAANLAFAFAQKSKKVIDKPGTPMYNWLGVKTSCA